MGQLNHFIGNGFDRKRFLLEKRIGKGENVAYHNSIPYSNLFKV